MVLYLAVSVTIAFITLGFGWPVLVWMKARPTSASASLAASLFTGLAVVTALAGWVSLVARIHFEFQIFLLLAAGVLWRRYKPYTMIGRVDPRGFSFWAAGGILAVVFVLLFNQAATPPANYDTGTYHQQVIRWINTYPAVPGLANYHLRLGYNSSWLTSGAVFSFPFFAIGPLYPVTLFVFLVFCGYAFAPLHAVIQGSRLTTSGLLRLTLGAASFVYLITEVSSPGTDAPTTLLIWFLVCEAARLIEERSLLADPQFILLAALTFFCVSAKLSSLLLAVGPAIAGLGLARRRDFRGLTWLAGLSAFFLLPYLGRNLVLSGYLVFPGLGWDPFHFDWRVPAETALEEARVIRWFASSPGTPFNEFETMHLVDWAPEWFARLLPRQKALLAACGGLPLLLAGLALIFRSLRRQIGRAVWLLSLQAILLCGIIFWFLSAPAMRFGYGALAAFASLPGCVLLEWLIQRLPGLKRVLRPLLPAGLLAVLLLFSRPYWSLQNLPQRWLTPLPPPVYPSAPCAFKNFRTMCQDNEVHACHSSIFPCAIYGNPDIEKRGESLREGFRYAP